MVEKKGVSIPRGTPPASVREAEELKKKMLGQTQTETKQHVEDPEKQEPSDRPGYPDMGRPIPPPIRTEPKIKIANLSGDLLDMEVPYIDSADTEFSVLFSLPSDTKLGVKPKSTMDFVLDCEDVTRQKVTYIGAPVEFKQTGIRLLVLLKTD